MAPEGPNLPRIGIPWRTSQEELAGNRPKIEPYASAVQRAGGEPVILSLSDAGALESQVQELDGFVLPGSPADLRPSDYGAVDAGRSAPPDPGREQADRVILSHAFNAQKPVLAICYGCQLLNVYLGGALVQDIRSEMPTTIAHRKNDVTPELKEDPMHDVRFTSGSRLAKMAEGTEAVINSSHHQAIAKVGRQLRISGQAADGVVESVEWTGDANWVIGVQWHPERMMGDPLAQRLFSDLIAASKGTQKTAAMKSYK